MCQVSFIFFIFIDLIFNSIDEFAPYLVDPNSLHQPLISFRLEQDEVDRCVTNDLQNIQFSKAFYFLNSEWWVGVTEQIPY